MTTKTLTSLASKEEEVEAATATKEETADEVAGGRSIGNKVVEDGAGAVVAPTLTTKGSMAATTTVTGTTPLRSMLSLTRHKSPS
jgi:hypothetical protein